MGVDFTPTGVAIVDVYTSGKNKGGINHTDFLPSVGASEQSKALKSWVEKNSLQKANCVTLLAKHDVQIFQLEKPKVEDEELLQAVSWKIKDLINYDLATAVVDTYELPPSPKSPLHYINAVVANESVVGAYVDVIRDSGLELEAIDIHDLVSRNYFHTVENSEMTTALLNFTAHGGTISIYHDQDLYVTRDFKIGLLDIEAALEQDAESVYDNLLLELQRSMDYYESTYGLGMVNKTIIFPHGRATEKMVRYLENYVGYDLDFVNLDEHARTMDSHCFSAYCAALRGLV